MDEISRRAVVVAAGGSVVSVAAITWSGSGSGGPPAAGEPVRTSFGSVTVLASSRVDAAGSDESRTTHATRTAAGHSNATPTDALVASAVHGAWTAGVVVDVEVRNRLRRPVGLSPGQFRVRVDRDGPTVSLYSSDTEAGPLEPGATRTLHISYLAPAPDRELSLTFDDTGSRQPVELGGVGRRPHQAVWS